MFISATPAAGKFIFLRDLFSLFLKKVKKISNYRDRLQIYKKIEKTILQEYFWHPRQNIRQINTFVSWNCFSGFHIFNLAFWYFQNNNKESRGLPDPHFLSAELGNLPVSLMKPIDR